MLITAENLELLAGPVARPSLSRRTDTLIPSAPASIIILLALLAKSTLLSIVTSSLVRILEGENTTNFGVK